MTKQELIAYMASICTILDSQDDSGVHLRSQTLGREYHRCWDQLIEMIRKEEEDEARKSKPERARGEEDRAPTNGHLAEGRESDRYRG